MERKVLGAVTQTVMEDREDSRVTLGGIVFIKELLIKTELARSISQSDRTSIQSEICNLEKAVEGMMQPHAKQIACQCIRDIQGLMNQLLHIVRLGQM